VAVELLPSISAIVFWLDSTTSTMVQGSSLWLETSTISWYWFRSNSNVLVLYLDVSFTSPTSSPVVIVSRYCCWLVISLTLSSIISQRIDVFVNTLNVKILLMFKLWALTELTTSWALGRHDVLFTRLPVF